MRIYFKIILYLLIFLFIFLVSIFYYYFSSKDIIENQDNDYIKYISQVVIKDINQYIENIKIDLKTIANTADENIFNYEESQIKLFKSIIENKNYSSIFITSANDQFLKVSRKDNKFFITKVIVKDSNLVKIEIEKNKKFIDTKYNISGFNGNFVTKFWFKDVKDIYISKPYKDNNKLILTISYPIYKYNKKILTISVNLNLYTLANIFNQEYKKFYDGVLFFDENYNFIVKDLDDISISDLKNINSKSFKNYLVYKYKVNIGNNKFTLIFFKNKVKILSELKKILVKDLIIFIILFLLSTIFFYIVFKKLSVNLFNINNNINKIKKFDLSLDNKSTSNIYEIKSLEENLLSTAKNLSIFKKYMPIELVNTLIKLSLDEKNGVVRKELSMMVVNLSNFLEINKNLPPSELTIELSEYFENITNIIEENNGIVNKYIGESIFAFWGAPIEQKDIVLRSVKTALLLKKEIDSINIMWEKIGRYKFEIQIGLYFGEAFVGNIGTNSYKDYTVIGESFHLVYLLEKLNSIYGTKILVTEDIVDILDKEFEFRKIDKILFENQIIEIYELIDYKENILDKDKKFLFQYEKALNSYYNKDFSQARYIWRDLLNLKQDIATKLFIKRCDYYIQNPPPNNWNGVFNS